MSPFWDSNWGYSCLSWDIVGRGDIIFECEHANYVALETRAHNGEYIHSPFLDMMWPGGFRMIIFGAFSFFASLKNQKTLISFLQAEKISKNMNVIFCKLKNLKKHEFHFLQA